MEAQEHTLGYPYHELHIDLDSAIDLGGASFEMQSECTLGGFQSWLNGSALAG
jgi:hypothetical protein